MTDRTDPAPLSLLTGPAGSGKTHEALARIREAATTPGARGRDATGPDDALLVLPTYAQVNHVKRRALSRWGVRGIFDRPFTTFTAAGERFLEAFHVRGLPSPEERDRLMQEALHQCVFRDIAQDRPHVFAGMLKHAGFRQHLLRLVKELKQTGLEGGEARELLGEASGDVHATSRPKLEAFLDVFQTYEDLLERAGLEDHEDALRRLAERMDQTTPQGLPRMLVVDGFDDFSQVEERILLSLARHVADAGGQVLVTLPWDPARPHVFAASRGTRDRLLAAGFAEHALGGFHRADEEPLRAIAGSLFKPPAEPLDGGAAVGSILAGDAEDEAESIARVVRGLRTADGFRDGLRGWRDVGIVVRSLATHGARLQGAFERLGVPLRVVGRGDPLASEPIVRALRGPLAVLADEIEEGAFEVAPLFAWLRWRALVGGDASEIEAIDRWEMRLRSEGFPADLHALRRDVPPEAQPAMDALGVAREVLRGVADAESDYSKLAACLPTLVPLPEPSGFDADGRPLDPLHDARLTRAVAALARVQGILGALQAAAERTGRGGAGSLAGAVEQLRGAIEQTTFHVADRRVDAVTLMDVEEARYWELGVVVVAGLEEGAFPLRSREDVLLRDSDREALRKQDDALRLPLAREREARERRLFYGAVTRATKRLIVSRRVYDDKGDPKEPSAYLRELDAVVTPTPLVVARTPGRVVRELDACFTAQDLRLFAAGHLSPWFPVDPDDADAVKTQERMRDLGAAIQSLTLSPAPGRAARMLRRASDPLSIDADTIERARAAFTGATRELSVSRLNHGVLCPHRFFLAYVVGVPRDDVKLRGPVFDARDRGQALHHAFEVAVREPLRSPADVARESVDSVGAHGITAELLRDEITQAVDLLRRRDKAVGGPLHAWKEGLEYAFRGDDAVEIGPKDMRFRLGGFIDRIDRGTPPDADDELAVIMDYKRSGTASENAFKSGRDGQDLQLPLYALAMEAKLGVRVVGFEWVTGLKRDRRIIHDNAWDELFEGRREAHKPKSEKTDDFRGRMDAAEDTAAEVVRRARAGDHTRAPSLEGTCKDCPWKHVCRPDVPELERRIGTEEDA